MFKEAPILDRKNRLDQQRREFMISQLLTLTVPGRQIVRQNFGCKRETIQSSAVAAQLFDLIAGIKCNAHYSGRRRLHMTGTNLDDIPGCREAAAPDIADIAFGI